MMAHPILAVIGAGGKTTALRALARSLSGRRVLLTTTTHIQPIAPPETRALLIDPDEAALRDALAAPGAVCAGAAASAGIIIYNILIFVNMLFPPLPLKNYYSPHMRRPFGKIFASRQTHHY